MRVRRICVTAVLALAAVTLAGCRTNVGTAAVIDGHRVSESDVNDYLTSASKPVTLGGGSAASSTIAPRSFVLDILIEQRFFAKVLAAAPSGSPSAGDISTLQKQFLRGSTADVTVRKLGVTGYTSALSDVVVQVQVLATLLNQEVSSGVDVNKIATALRFPVTVNPRYGAWNARAHSLVATSRAGLPAYLALQPAPAGS